ncbi:hypothetical protein DEIPH_ctg008orf0077 [Deinococcus phoenicis]|uniref:Uncharacterized protein n=1 Tax=Deinococcus phoenicis TaxID=1476583 RepID=A0A016QU77_9DEIO|nr:hypothetical protein [Deinococcus phoenicis]EYB69354.1 hypothetical protein DEIPH_ctg008orf0077 [Deinococcus phoenicis]
MDEGKPGDAPTRSPETTASYMGGEGQTPDANTNLDPNLQGGSTGADRQAARTIEQQHTQRGGLPAGLDAQSDPARQMDNSGMLDPKGEGARADDGAEIIGESGDDRNEQR